jgi:HSP90 family molecular chaperone
LDGKYSLKDYIGLKKPTQDRIFFAFCASQAASAESPYVYPLTKAGIPVLIVTTHMD